MTLDNGPSPKSFGDFLQGDFLHCIPTIYPGETLFSWCARYHRISGSISSVTTSQRLFGSKTAGFVVDFPGRIEVFSKVTAYILGSPEQLIKDHSLLPLYAAFRPQCTGTKVERMMLGKNVERVKFILGLPASRAATWHPLKFCLNCATEEVSARGVASWWREHQWPTVWICGLHQVTLHCQYSISGSPKLKTWLTPDELICDPRFRTFHLPRIFFQSLERLRSLTAYLAEKSPPFRPEILRLVFILRLRERGWIKPSGTFDMNAIQEAFLEKFSFLELLPGFEFIQGIKGDESGILGPMLRGSKRIQHPTKYVLLIDLLFDTGEQFFDLYHQHASTEDPDLYAERLKFVDTDTLEEKLHSLVLESRTPLNRAAKTLGISVQRVVAWAKKNNITYDKRPRRTGIDFQMRLDRFLQEGACRTSITEALNVSRRWITAYLARHPTERDKWRSANFSMQLSNRRAELLTILERNPGANLKVIQAIPKNPFQWLKRNDQDWLRENLPFFGHKSE